MPQINEVSWLNTSFLFMMIVSIIFLNVNFNMMSSLKMKISNLKELKEIKNVV